jgi:hypothetical protein
MNKNEIWVSLCIWDFEDLTHEQLTELIGISPSKIHIKNQ